MALQEAKIDTIKTAVESKGWVITRMKNTGVDKSGNYDAKTKVYIKFAKSVKNESPFVKYEGTPEEALAWIEKLGCRVLGSIDENGNFDYNYFKVTMNAERAAKKKAAKSKRSKK